MIEIFGSFGNIIWNLFFIPMLLLCGIILFSGCSIHILRHPAAAAKAGSGKSGSPEPSDGSISSLQAAFTALGSTIGTGNIVGTAQAIAMGGPGALFWMWAASAAGMAVKYAEIVLTVYFRRSNPRFGPMNYMEHAPGGKALAKVYCLLALISSFTMGNLTQANSIAQAVCGMGTPSVSALPFSHTLLRLMLGAALALLTARILSNDASGVGRASNILVPVMGILFLYVSGTVIAANRRKIPALLKQIVSDAFRPESALSAAAGLSLSDCIGWGVRRGAFSNEAGLGTSAFAHSTVSGSTPVGEGLWGIAEVFVDTVIICTLTGLSILCSGVPIAFGRLCGPELFCSALSTVFGNKLSSAFLAAALSLFSYTSLIAWGLYGRYCTEYLAGQKFRPVFDFLFIACIVFGCIMSTSQVWIIADFINALMSVPNLTAIFFLSPETIKITKDYILTR